MIDPGNSPPSQQQTRLHQPLTIITDYLCLRQPTISQEHIPSKCNTSIDETILCPISDTYISHTEKVNSSLNHEPTSIIHEYNNPIPHNEDVPHNMYDIDDGIHDGEIHDDEMYENEENEENEDEDNNEEEEDNEEDEDEDNNEEENEDEDNNEEENEDEDNNKEENEEESTDDEMIVNHGYFTGFNFLAQICVSLSLYVCLDGGYDILNMVAVDSLYYMNLYYERCKLGVVTFHNILHKVCYYFHWGTEIIMFTCNSSDMKYITIFLCVLI